MAGWIQTAEGNFRLKNLFTPPPALDAPRGGRI